MSRTEFSPLRWPKLNAGAFLGVTLLLGGCGTEPREQVHVSVQPIDEIAVQATPTAVAPGTGPGSVTFTWHGLLDGVPVSHDECVGMVSLTSPDGRLIFLDPSLDSCHGETELPIDAAPGTIPGEHRLSVILNGLRTELQFPVPG